MGNVIAQTLLQNNIPLYYYRRDEKLEIDFVTLLNNDIISIGVKFGHNTESISLNNIIKKNYIWYKIFIE